VNQNDDMVQPDFCAHFFYAAIPLIVKKDQTQSRPKKTESIKEFNQHFTQLLNCKSSFFALMSVLK